MAQDLSKQFIMKKLVLLLSITTLILSSHIFGQKPSLVLTFSSIDNEEWVSMDSIVIKNKTRDVDTTLYFPDTVLTLYYQVGMNDLNYRNDGFQVFQNFPNPTNYKTEFNIIIPDKGITEISITDVSGRQVNIFKQPLSKGLHKFEFLPGSKKLYIVSVMYENLFESIKIMSNNNNPGKTAKLTYIGTIESEGLHKTTTGINSFIFDKGDDLVCIGMKEGTASGIFDEPKEDNSYTFQFATNIPCPGDTVVDFEGQTYPTIQIFSQCWFRDNLNVGTMIPGNQEMEDNNTIEKYCYDDNESNCDDFGGLYLWDELMQYSTSSGSQGICPSGWHIPTDNDWRMLSGAVDSQYAFGNDIWYTTGNTGFDVGLNLKSIDGWEENGNGNDLFGFLIKPAGQRISNGYFDGAGYKATFWTSNEEFPGTNWTRNFSYLYDEIDRNSQASNWGKSVRCIRDQ
jgi:uncharacterized protein (TIGR02145 family)